MRSAPSVPGGMGANSGKCVNVRSGWPRVPGSGGGRGRRWFIMVAMSSDPEPASLGVGRLLVSCPDRPGIVAAVTSFLAGAGANIVESQQYSTDPSGGRFYLRLEFVLDRIAQRLPALEADFAVTAELLRMQTQWTLAATVKRMAVFVSRTDHALLELLWRTRSGELPADVRMIVSNHPDLAAVARSFDIPFHHTADEERQLELLEGEVDVIVLARYMQDPVAAGSCGASRPGSSTSTTRSCRPSSARTRTGRA